MNLEDEIRLVVGYVVSLSDTLADLRSRIATAQAKEQQPELAERYKRVRDQLALTIAELRSLDKRLLELKSARKSYNLEKNEVD
jgi:hypothetical protein